jgi:hypothetical protein
MLVPKFLAQGDFHPMIPLYPCLVSERLFVKQILVLAFLCFVAIAMNVANPAMAADKRIMTYDVYAGGIHALDATLTISTNSKGYDVHLESKTHGLLGKLAPWSGVFQTQGQFAASGDIYPIEHISQSTWKKETESKTFIYDGKGNFKSYRVTEGGKDTTPSNLDNSLTTETTDILSATLAMMRNFEKTPECKGDKLVFDGDRNFYLQFKDTKTENLQKNKYNIFDGEALFCTVEIKPHKGKWRKKPRGWLSIQEQGRQQNALPLIWFGKADNDEKSPYIPVKIRVKTNYGTLFMHLTSYRHTKD